MRRLVTLSFFVVLLGALACLCAQTTTGTFGGTVVDATGGRVARAAVTAINVETGQRYKTEATETGDFVIVQVPPGKYQVDVVAKGFKTLSRKGLDLEVAGKVTLELVLEVGAVNDSVTVTGEAPMLRTQDAQTGDVVDAKMIENVPQLNRNPLELLRLTGDMAGSATLGNQNDTRINGGRTSGLDVLIDGNTILAGKSHAVMPSSPPSMEQVAEFKIITNGIPAEYGRVSGGLLELATKSGTNGFHGQLFEYFRNQLLNANTWEQNWSSYDPNNPTKKAERMAFHQNDYGGNVGGPVILPKIYNGKNKTFFFFNFEGQNYRQAAVNRLGRSAPDSERNGNLSDLLYSGNLPLMYDPQGDIGKDDQGRPIKLTLFPGNGTIIPATRIDPLAKIILGYMPASNHANLPGFTQANAYLGQTGYSWDDYRWEVRIDHNITDNSRLTLRFNRDYWNDKRSQWYDDLSPADGDIRPGSIQGSLGWTWTATPSLIVELRGGVMHNPNLRNPTWNIANQDQWPIDPLMKQLTRNIPADLVYLDWAADPGWGGNNNLGNQDLVFQSLDSSTTYNGIGAVTKIWGRHTIKTGAELRRLFDNHWEDLFGTVTYGSAGANAVGPLNYQDNIWTSSHWQPNSFGSFLLGIPDASSKQSTLNLANATNYYAAYVQDDFKVSKKLTVNLGLRWDMETPLTERHNSITLWDPNRASPYVIPSKYNWNNALVQAGLTPAQIAEVPTPTWVTNGKIPNGYPCFAATPECPSRGQSNYYPWQFAPRLGAAYQLNNKTVLRGSWGMMYMTATGDYWSGWVVNASHAASFSTDRLPVTGNPAHNNANMFFPNQYIPFNPSTSYLQYNIASGYEGAGTSNTLHSPHEYNWNFSIQREIPWKMLVEAGYNGNHGSELISAAPSAIFPPSLVDPKYSALFKTMVENPLASQINNTGLYTNATVPLGILMLDNPAGGGLTVYGQNIGRSNYNAGSIKVQKRLAQGVTFLLTYTYSKLLDNVGQNSAGGAGGAKPTQSYQTISDLYGYSPQDMTQRFTFYHDVQLPFGKGRRFLGNPQGTGQKILDGIVGGWEYAGIWIYHTGTPLSFVPSNGSVSNYSGVGTLWGSITASDIKAITPSNYNSDNQVLVSGLDDPSKQTIKRFDPTLFTNPVDMTKGNIPPIYPWIRNPNANSYDGSLMKNFGLGKEGVFLQFRIEAQNMFNIRGLGTYNTTVGSADFGLITSSAQNPRNMQISARLFF